MALQVYVTLTKLDALGAEIESVTQDVDPQISLVATALDHYLQPAALNLIYTAGVDEVVRMDWYVRAV